MLSAERAKLRDLLPRIETPCYVYFLDILESRYRSLSAALGERCKILYSMKANPHPKFVKAIMAMGGGIDVSSLGELDSAISLGVPPESISFVGPGKSLLELERAINLGIHSLVVESISELEQVAKLANTKGRPANVMLRVNPHSYIQANGRPREASHSQFGIDDADLLQLDHRWFENLPLTIQGLHFYVQPHFSDAQILVENFRRFAATAVQIQSRWKMRFPLINFGGGFGIPYFHGQQELDLGVLKFGLQKLFAETTELRNAGFLAESGRYLAGPAGFFVTRVLYKKVSRGKTILICDGGFTQHQSATGSGQLIRRAFPLCALTDGSAQRQEKVTLAGPSCYSADILGEDLELDAVDVGDCIAVGQSGAYGASFSPTDFLSRPPANELFND
jgi:diaminopimelate decarboxylase